MDTTNRTNAPPTTVPSTKLRPSATPIPDGHSVTKRYHPVFAVHFLCSLSLSPFKLRWILTLSFFVYMMNI